MPRERLSDLYQAATEAGYTIPEAFAAGWVDEVAGMPLVRAPMWVRGQSIDIDIFLAESRVKLSLGWSDCADNQAVAISSA